MSRYSAELASAAVLSALPAFRAGLPLLPALIDFEEGDAVPAPIRHVHRDRDAGFGIGYGNSSGYGIERHYVPIRTPQRFRVM